jgi:hypothetical protein
MALAPNQFFDLNQFPKEEGIIVFGISMSRIGNRQSAVECFKDLELLGKKITHTEGIGLVTLYGDYLYFHSDAPAGVLRDRYKELMSQHKNGFLDLLTKDPAWIKKAFSFLTFGQVFLDNSEVFSSAWSKLLQFYAADEKFRGFVLHDVGRVGGDLGERGVSFILEEILIFYLASKGQLKFNNRFVSGTEKWILFAYPGKPLMSEIYLYQYNPLGLKNQVNVYENCYYDLEKKLLYDYSRLDIETFNFGDK